MKPGIPWSVKGIGADAREAAKEAARRRGMTLGAWLNTVIMEQSEAPVEQATGHNLRSRTSQSSEDVPARMDDLADQLTRLARKDERNTAGRPMGEARFSKEFNRILERIDHTERETAEAFAAVNDRIAGIGREIAQTGSSGLAVRPEDVPGYSALESALRNIIEHIADSETRSRDSLQAVHGRIDAIAARCDSGMGEAELERIEERLGEISTRMSRFESASRMDLSGPTKAEFARFAERIDALRAESDTRLQREINDVERRMQASLNEARSAAQPSLGAEGQRLWGEIEGLNQRIDDLKADAASERDLHSIRVAMEKISARVAQGTDLRPLADLEARIAEVNDRLGRSATGDHDIAPQFAELESRIGRLDQKLDRLVAERGEIPAWPAIEPQITALVDRLGQTESQLSHLANLERAIAQLSESVEQNRNWAQQASGPGQGESSAELRALVEGMDAMRASAAMVDQRNQETFTVIHEAISQIISRLGDMEGSAPLPIPAPQAEASTMAEAIAPLVRPADEVPFQPPHIPPLDRFAPELSKPHVTPLVAPLVTPLPAMPEIGAPIADARPPSDDFIAAARRAAQAASHHSNGSFAGSIGFLNRAKDKPQKKASGKGLSLPFLNRPKKAEEALPLPAAVEPAATAKTPDTAKRRRLLLIGIVLLAAASALAFGTFLRSHKPAPSAPAAKTSEVVPPTPTIPDAQPVVSISRMVDAMLTAALPSPSDDITARGSGQELPAAIGTAPLREAAIKGNANAQFIIAGRFLEGRGVTADPAQAAVWYEKAAEQGLAPAQYRLGTLYERGDGVARNMATALAWYERAAGGGNVKAMHNVAVIYAGAEAGAAGYQKAARWFEAAATYGLSDSQYNLGILFERGLGMEKNLVQAMYWYGLAARQGDQDANARLLEVAAALPPDLAAKTQARIDAFVPRPEIESANRVSVTEMDWQAPGPTAELN
ncbi:MAG: SEL1-like repeat protein [Rhizobiales bacterium]|nr:SEL1-like repeat protein [Hyphomicrobiales bacterium]